MQALESQGDMHLAMLERRRNHLNEKIRENVSLSFYQCLSLYILQTCTQYM